MPSAQLLCGRSVNNDLPSDEAAAQVGSSCSHCHRPCCDLTAFPLFVELGQYAQAAVGPTMRSGKQASRSNGKEEDMNWSNVAKGVAIVALLAYAADAIGGDGACRRIEPGRRDERRLDLDCRCRPARAARRSRRAPRRPSRIPPRQSPRLRLSPRLSPGLSRLSSRLRGLGPSRLVSLGARRSDRSRRRDRRPWRGGRSCLGAAAASAGSLLVLYGSKPAQRLLGRLPVTAGGEARRR